MYFETAKKIAYPSILEGALAHLLSFFLKLLDCTFINAAALVDEMAGSSGLSRVHMADDDDVDMSLLFTHLCGSRLRNMCEPFKPTTVLNEF